MLATPDEGIVWFLKTMPSLLFKKVFMKNPFIFSILISTLISPLLFAQQAKLSKHLSTITNPTPIIRVMPKYPISAARNKREGWAKMSFIVETDGSVSNVLVTETSGSKDFAIAAKKAVSKWKYQPAFEDGKPIQQCLNIVQMDFKMTKGGQTGVTRRFRSTYNKALEALKNKEYEQVEQLLLTFKKIKKLHLSENNYYHILAADYAKAINDKALQLHHLYRVTLSNERLTPASQQLSILIDRFTLEVSLNKFHSALATLNKLHALPAAKPYLVNLDKTMAKVDAFIGGDSDFIINGNIKDKDYWQHALIRNEFSIINIDGRLNKLDVRCANKRHVYTVENDNTWTIPSSWKNCSIFVFGEDKASFKLIEHPLKS